jgi:hypothetical protein
VSLRRWWKCKIASKDEGQREFKKGDLVFAKNGENNITLFDGKKWVSLPKMAVKKIKLLSRLSDNEDAFVERYYQFKLRRASHPSVAGGPVTIEGREAERPYEAKVDESPNQTPDVLIPLDALFGKDARKGL